MTARGFGCQGFFFRCVRAFAHTLSLGLRDVAMHGLREALKPLVLRQLTTADSGRNAAARKRSSAAQCPRIVFMRGRQGSKHARVHDRGLVTMLPNSLAVLLPRLLHPRARNQMLLWAAISAEYARARAAGFGPHGLRFPALPLSLAERAPPLRTHPPISDRPFW